MNHQDGRSLHGTQAQRVQMAAVLTGPRQFETRSSRLPEPAPGEVRVRLEGCGICASNIEPWSGPEWMHYPSDPGALGHEGWGVVDAVGEGVVDLHEGQRVATLFQSSFAQFDCGPASMTVPLPATIEGDFPGEPLACAMNIFARSQIREGDTVAIIGIGFLGAILTSLAVDAGARVIAISRRSSALDLARRRGADHCLALDDHQAIVSAVEDFTEGAMCRCVIEAAGQQWPLDLAAELTAVRGRLVIAGYHQDGPRQVNMQLWNWRGLDVINAHERDPAVYRTGLLRAIHAVVAGKIELGGLITHRYTLETLNEGLSMARDRPDGFLKGVVLMA